jgi:hypothetical protein
VPNGPLLKVKAGVAKRLSYFPEDELEAHQFAWKWELTPEHRAANLATTSMLIAMEPEQRAERLQAAHSELQRICDAAGTTSMPIRHEASCVRWTPGPQP